MKMKWMILAVLMILMAGSVAASSQSFLEEFTGDPSAPLAWNSADWDVTVHSRDVDTWHTLEPMDAQHGTDCAPPPATHPINAYEETVYQCRNHLMTALTADGYGLIYLTPNQMVDFSDGEAIIRFEVSTARESSRDWIDVWITPYEDNLQLVLDNWLPDLTGEPRRSVHVVMDFSDNSRFRGEIFDEFIGSDIPITSDGWQGYEYFLEPSATRRDVFELRISETHIAFGMPDYNFWWLDTDIDALGWTTGVVQLGHHSYNPEKACNFDGTCGPNTWHWDNVSISHTSPLAFIKANRRYVDDDTTAVVNFDAPAPADAHLRFAGIGNDLEVSFDGGNGWISAELQAQRADLLTDEHFKSYWMPIPEGIDSVHFRGQPFWGGGWHVRDISIWSQNTVPTAVDYQTAPNAVASVNWLLSIIGLCLSLVTFRVALKIRRQHNVHTFML